MEEEKVSGSGEAKDRRLRRPQTTLETPNVGGRSSIFRRRLPTARGQSVTKVGFVTESGQYLLVVYFKQFVSFLSGLRSYLQSFFVNFRICTIRWTRITLWITLMPQQPSIFAYNPHAFFFCFTHTCTVAATVPPSLLLPFRPSSLFLTSPTFSLSLSLSLSSLSPSLSLHFSVNYGFGNKEPGPPSIVQGQKNERTSISKVDPLQQQLT